jgi:hypothetical protein
MMLSKGNIVISKYGNRSSEAVTTGQMRFSKDGGVGGTEAKYIRMTIEQAVWVEKM